MTLPDGGESFVHRNQLMVDAGLTINQNIPFTGGSLFVKTALQRLDLFSEKTSSYNTTPIVLGYEQNLFGIQPVQMGSENRTSPLYRIKKEPDRNTRTGRRTGNPTVFPIGHRTDQLGNRTI